MTTSTPAGDPPDSVDRLLRQWQQIRPELDLAPVGVVQRLGRVRHLLEAEIESGFAEFGLNGPDYAALSTLLLLEGEQRVSQRWLMRELGLTSGTVSTRVDRLVKQGLLDRTADPDDRRNSLIALTDAGRTLIERVTPAHLAVEDRLLAALDPGERAVLAGLLRRLLNSFEGSVRDPDAAALGVTVASARKTAEMRHAVALPVVTGLLVRSVVTGGPAAAAGISVGDVLTRVGDEELRSIAPLRAGLHEHPARPLPIELLRGTESLCVTVEPVDAALRYPRPAPGEHQL